MSERDELIEHGVAFIEEFHKEYASTVLEKDWELIAEWMADFAIERMRFQQAEIERLRSVLEHYAKKVHWDESGVYGAKHDLYLGPVYWHGARHGWEVARAALGGEVGDEQR